MTDTATDQSAVKRALVEIRRLRQELAQTKARQHEPIAVVGMGLRFPGSANSPAQFWDLLRRGGDAIVDIPPSRWPVDEFFDADPDAAGKTYVRQGGFVDDVDQFDHQFFGITPREAQRMDPQQRLLLEVSWQALEDAGLAGSHGRRGGVFVGITSSDYGRALLRDPAQLDAYVGTGGALSVAAGRLSYVLGLRGPSMAVDTACSSSLTGVHLASDSLRRGECDFALAGGVNLILSPEYHVSFTRARMLAPDGRCKTFDAAADGYVRSEGCGVLVLKRLSDAQRDGDQIVGLVRGSAVNQDGKVSGLTVPNGPAQSAVIRDALAAARLKPSDVDFVEAHGTGTSLGDPIELHALGEVFNDRGEHGQPLRVGSVKSNIGHLEAAAGVAGLIKVLLCLKAGELAPSIHFQSPNPRVEWDQLSLSVNSDLTPWPAADRLRVAGVSSFGFGGSNAHVIVSAAPGHEREEEPSPQPCLVPLSGRSQGALSTITQRLAAAIEPTMSLAGLSRTLTAGRQHFEQRKALVVSGLDELGEALASNQPVDDDATAEDRDPQPPRVAFLISGSSTRLRTGALALLAQEPGFEPLLTTSTDSLTSATGRSLDELLSDPQLAPTVAEPLAVAIGASLCRLWQTWGIEPVAVLGTGSGELVAASACGALDLAGAMLLAQVEGQIKDQIRDQVKNQKQDQPLERLALSLPMTELEPLLSRHPSVRLVADNGAAGTVVQGPTGAVSTLTEALAAIPAVRCQPLTAAPEIDGPVDWPALTGGRPELAMLSTVTGQELEGETLTQGSHWQGHLTGAVQLGPALGALPGLGVDTVLEIGFDGQLLALSRLASGQHASWLSAAGDDGAGYGLLRQLGQLYALGAEINWSAYDRDRPGRKVSLPTYPFERSRFWLEEPAASAEAMPALAPGGEVSAEERARVLVNAGLRQQQFLPLDLKLEGYHQFWSLLDQLTDQYLQQTLLDLNLFTAARTRHSVAEVMAAGQFDDQFTRLVTRWLSGLVDTGQLSVSGDHYEAPAALVADRIPELLAAARSTVPEADFMVDYLQSCGENLAAVLSGRLSALDLLFPQGSTELAEKMYHHWHGARYINGIATAVVHAAASATSDTFRLIEVGAGVGGTTATALPGLPAGRSEYHFTDLSEFFFSRARSKFGDHPAFQCGLLDLEVAPENQGWALGHYDVVLAANVVHAVGDLRAALNNVRRLLRPGGALLMVEATSHLRWYDATTGLIEGWHRYDDPVRKDQPLLNLDQWREELTRAGFSRIECLPQDLPEMSVLHENVILAFAPDSGQERRPAAGGDQTAAATPALQTPALAQAAVPVPDLAGLNSDDAGRAMLRYVVAQVRAITGLSASTRISQRQRLSDLGIDSLMAVELRNRISVALGLDDQLPATLMFDYPTPKAIADHLLTLVGNDPGADSQAGPTLEAEAKAPDLDDLDDDDIARMLEQKLMDGDDN